jgi:hypothetical protein
MTGAHLALGWAAFLIRRSHDAVVEYQRALDINPNFAAAHGHLGRTPLVRMLSRVVGTGICCTLFKRKRSRSKRSAVFVRLGPPQAGHYRPRSTDAHSKSAGFHIDATQANYAENPSSLPRASRYSEAVAGRHARPFHGPSSDTGGVLACSQASESRSKHVRGQTIAI